MSLWSKLTSSSSDSDESELVEVNVEYASGEKRAVVTDRKGASPYFDTDYSSLEYTAMYYCGLCRCHMPIEHFPHS